VKNNLLAAHPAQLNGGGGFGMWLSKVLAAERSNLIGTDNKCTGMARGNGAGLRFGQAHSGFSRVFRGVSGFVGFGGSNHKRDLQTGKQFAPEWGR
jgi:hypothetical protein